MGTAFPESLWSRATELKLSSVGPDGGLHYWLLLEGEPVAYAKVYERTEAQGTVVELCDIETREGFRNRGYATAILEAIAEGYGVDRVSHGGSYTPDGYSYISSKLKRIGNPSRGPAVAPMGFVHDWATLAQKYR